MADIKVIPLKELFRESFSYMCENCRNIALFSVVHMLFLIAGFEMIDGWHDVFFLPWLVGYYLFGVSFFVLF